MVSLNREMETKKNQIEIEKLKNTIFNIQNLRDCINKIRATTKENIKEFKETNQIEASKQRKNLKKVTEQSFNNM